MPPAVLDLRSISGFIELADVMRSRDFPGTKSSPDDPANLFWTIAERREEESRFGGIEAQVSFPCVLFEGKVEQFNCSTVMILIGEPVFQRFSAAAGTFLANGIAK